MGLSEQVAPLAGRAAVPSDSSQRISALTPPGCALGVDTAIAVTPSAGGVPLGGRALYPGGFLLVILMGV